MCLKITKNRNAFTLIELMVTIAISFIVVMGIGTFMVSVQRGWGQMFNRVHGDVVQDAYISRKAFDGTVRKAARHYTIAEDKTSVEVDYWNDTANNDAEFPDRYAKFYWLDDKLFVEHGIRVPRAPFRTQILAENVTDCRFTGTGTALKMSLQLDDGKQKLQVITSAVLHN